MVAKPQTEVHLPIFHETCKESKTFPVINSNGRAGIFKKLSCFTKRDRRTM